MEEKDEQIMKTEKTSEEEDDSLKKDDLKLDHINLEVNQERCLSSNSESSQDLMFSSCSSPLRTPFSQSCENLTKDENFLIKKDKIKNDLLNELKSLQNDYEKKINTISDERNILVEQVKDLKSKLTLQENEFNSTILDVKTQFNSKLDKVLKESESSRKHLEFMVVNYAKSEKEVILTKKGKDEAEKKLRDALKDKDSLFLRVKGLSSDKASLKSLLDKRNGDFLILQKEIERLKEDVKDRESKLKQAQYDLKLEIEAHEDTCKKFSKILSSSEKNRVNDQNQGQESESQLNKENNSQQEKENVENNHQGGDEIELEINMLKSEINSLKSENQSLLLKSNALEIEKIENQETILKLNLTLNNLKKEYIDCNNKLNDFEEVKLKLEKEIEEAENVKSELAQIKEANEELRIEMDICRHKEGELLEFTERLTEKSVSLQSAHNILDQKCTTLQDELNRSLNIIKDLKVENNSLSEMIKVIKLEKDQEVNLLARKVAEKSKMVEDEKAKIEELENENKVAQKRYLNSIKELNREINQMKKQLDACENQSEKNFKYNLTDEISTTFKKSCSSSPLSEPVTSFQLQNNTSSKLETENDLNAIDTLPQLDKKLLINKIIKLQKVIAKKQEKIDFLDEHNQSLVQEMKKKTKLIQYYIIREEAGALSTNRMDENKKQLAKHGSSIMSSLYKSCPSDPAITLSLSLEINKKLQAILEDTILKNITLKENLNTLGEEIAKLTQRKQKYFLTS